MILTAPAKGGDIPTVVAGVNDDRVVAGESIYSAASCTTNAIVPVLKIMNDAFGIQVRILWNLALAMNSSIRCFLRV